MKAGHELDALIAERVMGLRRIKKNFLPPNDDPWSTGRPPRPYSTDIAAAWEVVEKLESECARFQLVRWWDGLAWRWTASFATKSRTDAGGYPMEITADGAAAPHAICLAALRAVGADPE